MYRRYCTIFTFISSLHLCTFYFIHLYWQLNTIYTTLHSTRMVGWPAKYNKNKFKTNVKLNQLDKVSPHHDKSVSIEYSPFWKPTIWLPDKFWTNHLEKLFKFYYSGKALCQFAKFTSVLCIDSLRPLQRLPLHTHSSHLLSYWWLTLTGFGIQLYSTLCSLLSVYIQCPHNASHITHQTPHNINDT